MKKNFIGALLLLLFFSAGVYTVPAQTTLSNETSYVIPGGETVGIKLYTKGLLVIGLSDGTSPAESAGLKQGDIILTANGTELNDTSELSEIVSAGNPVNIEYLRKDKKHSVQITPQIISGIPRLGVWLRDSTAGLGTVTFYNGNNFAALGHAVTDSDTGKIMTLSNGSITGAKIAGITPGKKGVPGELIGSFLDNTLGNIEQNCANGLYGTCTSPPQKTPLKIAERSEVHEGEAYIIADIDGKGAKNYTVNIERLSFYTDTKSIVFKVTDKTLLSKTGGIVQGMSGAPIIQNNQLVGAVTHVFVNDPCRGYGIFAENMLFTSENK